MGENVSLVLFVIIIVVALFFQFFKLEDENVKKVKLTIAPVFPEIMDLRIQVGDKSRIYNKRDIFLKIYKSHGVPYDNNTLVYTCLHEISHIVCEKHDTSRDKHSPEFYRIFDKILDVSIAKGVFNPSIPLDKDFLDTGSVK